MEFSTRVWIHDNNPGVVRALLQQVGMIEVNKEGRYLLDVNLASVDWPLREQAFASHVCGMAPKHRLISKRENYISRSGKDDYDAIRVMNLPLRISIPFIIIQ